MFKIDDLKKDIMRYQVIKKCKDKILNIYIICLVSLLLFNLFYFLLFKSVTDLKFLVFFIITFCINVIFLAIYKIFIDKTKINKNFKDKMFINLLLVFININVFHYKNNSFLFINILIILISVIFCNKDLLKYNFYKIFFINCIYYFVLFSNNQFSLELIKELLIISAISLLIYIISTYIIDLITEGLEYMLTINRRQEIFSNNFQKAINDLKIEPMTGLLNKKAMYDEILLKISNLKNHNKESHLVIIDLDYFKKVNDTYGHPNGDKVLITLANLLKSKLKNKASVCRYGGEEFVIIFEKQKTEEVYKIMEDIRISFSNCKFNFLDGQYLTLSGGISKLRKEFNAESWLSDADTALYKAKQNGRNQIIINR